MGAVAARLSDTVGLTSDNPRSEDPTGSSTRSSWASPRRRTAAGRPQRRVVDGHRAPVVARHRSARGHRTCHRGGRTGDVVVIAGKGHEKYQVIRDRVLPFDDVAEAREALARRRLRRAS